MAFKNPAMQKLYAVCRASYDARDETLFYLDRPRRGSATSGAFWNGYDGQPARHSRTSLAYAAWAAGRDAERAGR